MIGNRSTGEESRRDYRGALIIMLLAGCSSSDESVQTCPATDYLPIGVTLVDSTTGAPVCDATVTTSDNGQVILPRAEHASWCANGGEYQIFVDPGSYTVTVDAPGHRTPPPQQVEVRTTGECDAIVTVHLRYDLEPLK